MNRSSHQLFPPNPPTSLTDQADIIRNDWAAFSSLDKLANHWERPAWPDGAQAYYWLLPLGQHRELRIQTQACQETLAGVPDLDPVPADLLHLTLYRVGTLNAISEEHLARIADVAAKRLASVEPISLSIGPLAGSTGAIRYSVTPWNRLVQLRDELIAATNSVLDSAPITVGGPTSASPTTAAHDPRHPSSTLSTNFAGSHPSKSRSPKSTWLSSPGPGTCTNGRPPAG